MDTVREVFETLRQVSQARTGGRQVRRINLRQVAQAHHFGPRARTGDDGFHLMRGQVLTFVDQDQALLEAAAPDVVQGFELQRHLAQDVIHAAVGAFIVHVQRFQVVGDRPQPRLHFLGLGAGQEADLLVQPLHAAGTNDAPVTLADHGLLNGCGQREDGFARTRGAREVDQMDVRIKQGIQRQPLVNVTRLEAPGFLMKQGLLVHVENQQVVLAHLLDPTHEALFVDDEFVDVNRGQVFDQLHLVPRAAVPLTGFYLADAVPERTGHGVIAA